MSQFDDQEDGIPSPFQYLNDDDGDSDIDVEDDYSDDGFDFGVPAPI